ncbi:sugar transferase [Actinospongicola halichondriae]|uniref:sugar transferase n=1 Tax=Actinospongicola halichondriae TaxID=3236844 RepID=UPI003D38017E
MQRQPVRKLLEAGVALTLFTIALPVICLGALASFISYRAWPFFVQERVGYEGRTIRIRKIRTLPPATAQYADKYSIRANEIPRAMKLLRRLHIDELPQLLHVCRGDMAFVGPRPEMAVLHDALPDSFASERTSVAPGLTGLWQISPHNQQLIGERPEYDRLYVSFRSTKLDAFILRRTMLKMTLGRPTYLHEVPVRVVNDERARPLAHSSQGRTVSLVD